MTPRRKRLWSVALMVCGVAAATAFALQAFQKNLLYFYNPSQVRSGEAPAPAACSASAEWWRRARCGAPRAASRFASR